jgi:hypothetical protein
MQSLSPPHTLLYTVLSLTESDGESAISSHLLRNMKYDRNDAEISIFQPLFALSRPVCTLTVEAGFVNTSLHAHCKYSVPWYIYNHTRTSWRGWSTASSCLNSTLHRGVCFGTPTAAMTLAWVCRGSVWYYAFTYAHDTYTHIYTYTYIHILLLTYTLCTYVLVHKYIL